MPERVYIGANPRGNNRQRRTDYELHDQPGPKRIPRIFYYNMYGMLDSDVNAWPVYNHFDINGPGGVLPPGHTRIPKIIYHAPNTIGSSGVFQDETLQVDSPSVGTPLN